MLALLVLFLFILFMLVLLASCHLMTPVQSEFLSKREILERFVGNSEIGLTNNTESIYELYFPNDREVILRKRKDSNCEMHSGTWTIDEDGTITSHWPTYSYKHYVIKYIKLGHDTYSVYNVKDACGPAGTICREFIRVPGNIFDTAIC